MHPTLFQPFMIIEKHTHLSRPSFSSSGRCGLWAVCGPAARWAGLGWRGASAAALLVGAACNSSRGSSRWNWRTFWTCERVGGEKQHKAERANQKQKYFSHATRKWSRHFCKRPTTPNSAPSPLHQTLASATKTEVYAHRRAASNLSLHILHENWKTLHAGVKLLSQLHLLPRTVRFTCDSSKSNRYFMKQGWSIK